jgi:hypothetical protein
MMRAPTELELDQLAHISLGSIYDPVKAHEYYERTKQLKGRKRGQANTSSGGLSEVLNTGRDPRTGKAMPQIHREARAKQRKELSDRIQSLSNKLAKLEAKIREMSHEEASEDRKGKAKKERAAKEREKPDTAAEKAEKARESKKDRAKNQQETKNKAKEASDKSGGGSSSKTKSGSKASQVSELKALATKVKGQIAVAKQKLAAL